MNYPKLSKQLINWDLADLENILLELHLSALWASPRASAQTVTSKWQLRTTSPVNTDSMAGENRFLAKTGPGWAVYASICIILRGTPKQILMAVQLRPFCFSCRWPFLSAHTPVNVLDTHPSNALPCQWMDVGRGSHSLSAEGTLDVLKPITFQLSDYW